MSRVSVSDVRSDVEGLDRRQISLTMDPGSRDRVHSLGVLLGIIGTCGYVAGLIASGGLANVYSRAKGHIVTSTGYLGSFRSFASPPSCSSCWLAVGVSYEEWTGFLH